MNSCDGALIKRIEEKCENLDEPEQGGIMYLNISFDEMFNMINVVSPSLHDSIKNFFKDGIDKVPNEIIFSSDSDNECCV